VSLRTARRIAIAVAILSAALGFLHLYSIRSAPQFHVPVLDEASYDAQAVGILEGRWPAGKVFYQDPLYPYFLAFMYHTLGRNLAAVKVVQVILGALVVLLIFGIGRRAFGPGTGLAAAVIVALYRPLYFFEGVLTKEIVCLVLVGASLLTLLWAYNESRLWKWAVPGVFLGAACLARANLLLMAPAWGIWIVLSLRRNEGWKHSFLAALVFSAGVFVAISPTTVHNLRAGDLVLVTSQGGQNFYIGNHPGNLTGTYQSPRFVRANPMFEETDFRRQAEKMVGRKLKPSEISRFYYRLALYHIKNSPGDSFRRLLRKTELAVNNFEISDNLNYYFFRERYSRVLRLPTPGWGIIAALAIWGALVLIFRGRRGGDEVVVGLAALTFAAVYSATLVAYYVFARYRLPLLAATAPLAAFGLKAIVDYIAERRWKYFFVGLALIVALSAWTHRSIIEPRFDVAHYQTGNCLAKLGNWKEAEKEYREAILIEPDRAAYRINLAGTLYELGRYAEALEQYRLALMLAPRNVKAHIGIAQTYSALDRHEDAVTHYQMALLYGGDSSNIWTRLGNEYLKLGMHASATSCFKEALELNLRDEAAKKLLEKARGLP